MNVPSAPPLPVRCARCLTELAKCDDLWLCEGMHIAPDAFLTMQRHLNRGDVDREKKGIVKTPFHCLKCGEKIVSSVSAGDSLQYNFPPGSILLGEHPTTGSKWAKVAKGLPEGLVSRTPPASRKSDAPSDTSPVLKPSLDNSSDDKGFYQWWLHLETTRKVPRPYQRKACAEALRQNLVVVLPTGTGKTLVAAMVLAAFSKMNPHKLVCFVVDRVPLVFQQAEALVEDTGLNVEHLCGETSGAAVTRRIQRKACDAVVATAGSLLEAVRVGRVSPLLFSCFVFDECHHAKSNHPYAALSRLIAGATADHPEAAPRMIGLTASPFDGKLRSVTERAEEMKGMLHGASFFTPEDVPATSCKVQWVRLHKEDDDTSAAELRTFTQDLFHPVVEELLRGVNGKIAFNDYMQEGELDVPRLHNDLRRHLQHCDSSPSRALSVEVLRDLQELLIFIDVHELACLLGVRVAMEEISQQDASLPTASRRAAQLRNFSPKAPSKLLSVLCSRITSTGRDSSSRVLVFVDTRLAALRLQRKIKEETKINTAYVVGHGGADGMGWDQQKAQISRFRRGTHPVLVSTSVLEEGIDVPVCDTVIKLVTVRMSAIRLIQTRGRARKFGSDVVCFTLPSIDPEAEQRRLDAEEKRIADCVTRLSHNAGLPTAAVQRILREHDEAGQVVRFESVVSERSLFVAGSLEECDPERPLVCHIDARYEKFLTRRLAVAVLLSEGEQGDPVQLVCEALQKHFPRCPLVGVPGKHTLLAVPGGADPLLLHTVELSLQARAANGDPLASAAADWNFRVAGEGRAFIRFDDAGYPPEPTAADTPAAPPPPAALLRASIGSPDPLSHTFQEECAIPSACTAALSAEGTLHLHTAENPDLRLPATAISIRPSGAVCHCPEDGTLQVLLTVSPDGITPAEGQEGHAVVRALRAMRGLCLTFFCGRGSSAGISACPLLLDAAKAARPSARLASLSERESPAFLLAALLCKHLPDAQPCFSRFDILPPPQADKAPAERGCRNHVEAVASFAAVECPEPAQASQALADRLWWWKRGVLQHALDAAVPGVGPTLLHGMLSRGASLHEQRGGAACVGLRDGMLRGRAWRHYVNPLDPQAWRGDAVRAVEAMRKVGWGALACGTAPLDLPDSFRPEGGAELCFAVEGGGGSCATPEALRVVGVREVSHDIVIRATQAQYLVVELSVASLSPPGDEGAVGVAVTPQGLWQSGVEQRRFDVAGVGFSFLCFATRAAEGGSTASPECILLSTARPEGAARLRKRCGLETPGLPCAIIGHPAAPLEVGGVVRWDGPFAVEPKRVCLAACIGEMLGCPLVPLQQAKLTRLTEVLPPMHNGLGNAVGTLLVWLDADLFRTTASGLIPSPEGSMGGSCSVLRAEGKAGSDTPLHLVLVKRDGLWNNSRTLLAVHAAGGGDVREAVLQTELSISAVSCAAFWGDGQPARVAQHRQFLLSPQVVGYLAAAAPQRVRVLATAIADHGERYCRGPPEGHRASLSRISEVVLRPGGHSVPVCGSLRLSCYPDPYGHLELNEVYVPQDLLSALHLGGGPSPTQVLVVPDGLPGKSFTRDDYHVFDVRHDFPAPNGDAVVLPEMMPVLQKWNKGQVECGRGASPAPQAVYLVFDEALIGIFKDAKRCKEPDVGTETKHVWAALLQSLAGMAREMDAVDCHAAGVARHCTALAEEALPYCLMQPVAEEGDGGGMHASADVKEKIGLSVEADYADHNPRCYQERRRRAQQVQKDFEGAVWFGHACLDVSEANDFDLHFVMPGGHPAETQVKHSAAKLGLRPREDEAANVLVFTDAEYTFHFHLGNAIARPSHLLLKEFTELPQLYHVYRCAVLFARAAGVLRSCFDVQQPQHAMPAEAFDTLFLATVGDREGLVQALLVSLRESLAQPIPEKDMAQRHSMLQGRAGEVGAEVVAAFQGLAEAAKSRQLPKWLAKAMPQLGVGDEPCNFLHRTASAFCEYLCEVACIRKALQGMTLAAPHRQQRLVCRVPRLWYSDPALYLKRAQDTSGARVELKWKQLPQNGRSNVLYLHGSGTQQQVDTLWESVARYRHAAALQYSSTGGPRGVPHRVLLPDCSLLRLRGGAGDATDMVSFPLTFSTQAPTSSRHSRRRRSLLSGDAKLPTLQEHSTPEAVADAEVEGSAELISGFAERTLSQLEEHLLRDYTDDASLRVSFAFGRFYVIDLLRSMPRMRFDVGELGEGVLGSSSRRKAGRDTDSDSEESSSDTSSEGTPRDIRKPDVEVPDTEPEPTAAVPAAEPDQGKARARAAKCKEERDAIAASPKVDPEEAYRHLKKKAVVSTFCHGRLVFPQVRQALQGLGLTEREADDDIRPWKMRVQMDNNKPMTIMTDSSFVPKRADASQIFYTKATFLDPSGRDDANVARTHDIRVDVSSSGASTKRPTGKKNLLTSAVPLFDLHTTEDGIEYPRVNEEGRKAGIRILSFALRLSTSRFLEHKDSGMNVCVLTGHEMEYAHEDAKDGEPVVTPYDVLQVRSDMGGTSDTPLSHWLRGEASRWQAGEWLRTAAAFVIRLSAHLRCSVAEEEAAG